MTDTMSSMQAYRCPTLGKMQCACNVDGDLLIFVFLHVLSECTLNTSNHGSCSWSEVCMQLLRQGHQAELWHPGQLLVIWPDQVLGIESEVIYPSVVDRRGFCLSCLHTPWCIWTPGLMALQAPPDLCNAHASRDGLAMAFAYNNKTESLNIIWSSTLASQEVGVLLEP